MLPPKKDFKPLKNKEKYPGMGFAFNSVDCCVPDPGIGTHSARHPPRL
jgi:hypothetical protein